MNKIFNWTVGSFFRSIGRIIAYLVIGGLIAFVLSDNGFKIQDLFFDNVKASENYTSGLVPSPFYYSNSQRTNPLSIINIIGGSMTFVGYSENLSSDAYYINREYVFYFSNRITNTSSANTIIVPLVLQNLQTRLNISGTILLFDTQGGVYTCELVGNSSDQQFYNIICPFKQGRALDFISMNVNIRSQSGSQAFRVWDIGISPFYTLRLDTNQDVINNQNQNTQSIINQQQNSTQQMLESNTTQAESDATDFFGNFTVSDTGGLSAIITAPLNTIQSLLSSTCTNLVLPLPFVNQNLTLPCMNDIYTTHFGAFFTLYQTIILAIIAYRCIRSIFFDIKGFSDPDDDRIEVMDL